MPDCLVIDRVGSNAVVSLEAVLAPTVIDDPVVVCPDYADLSTATSMSKYLRTTSAFYKIDMMSDTNGRQKRTFQPREKRTANMDKEVLDVPRAAMLLGLSPAAVSHLARKREIPSRKVGREWRFTRATIVNWIAGKHAEPDPMDFFKNARLRK